MKYLPFENITLRTKLGSEEVLKRINENIEPKRKFRMKGNFGNNDHKSYEGSIDEMEFNITRIIGYNNSFLPRIKGIIETDFHGTYIMVKMNLHPAVLLFICIWFTGVLLGCLVVLNAYLSDVRFEWMHLIPFAMLLFGYAITMGGFKYESIRSKKDLAKLFEAEIV